MRSLPAYFRAYDNDIRAHTRLMIFAENLHSFYSFNMKFPIPFNYPNNPLQGIYLNSKTYSSIHFTKFRVGWNAGVFFTRQSGMNKTQILKVKAFKVCMITFYPCIKELQIFPFYMGTQSSALKDHSHQHYRNICKKIISAIHLKCSVILEILNIHWLERSREIIWKQNHTKKIFCWDIGVLKWFI